MVVFPLVPAIKMVFSRWLLVVCFKISLIKFLFKDRAIWPGQVDPWPKFSRRLIEDIILPVMIKKIFITSTAEFLSALQLGGGC